MIGPETGAYASVVIVAAGRGERFGDTAKVMVLACGKPLIGWSLAAAEARCVREIVVVTGSHTHSAITSLLDTLPLAVPVSVVIGGVRRRDSVAAGIAVVSNDSEVVLVHDAARPMVTAAIFDACAREARLHGAAIVATPVADTIKRVAEHVVVDTVARDGLWLAQTPQGFRRDVIQDAVERCRLVERDFTDEASMLEHLGIPVRIVPGSRDNLKVTHPGDLALVDALLRQRKCPAPVSRR